MLKIFPDRILGKERGRWGRREKVASEAIERNPEGESNADPIFLFGFPVTL